MMNIETEKVLEAVIERLFSDSDDECPKAQSAYYMLDTIKRENNGEIIRQLGAVEVKPCDPNCPHRKKRNCQRSG